MNGKKEFGDYQTPIDFAEKVCKYLKGKLDLHPDIIIEPSCGKGAFIKSALCFESAKKILGFEINSEYCKICEDEIKDSRVSITKIDILRHSLKSYTEKFENTLILGNPPWVTNSSLSRLGSKNIPKKSNIKNLNGMQALTGESNFDICETIILQLANEFKSKNATIAMLCKTSVARNVFAQLSKQKIGMSLCRILEFDAKKIFGINAAACLFIMQFDCKKTRQVSCQISSFDIPDKEISSLILCGKNLVRSNSEYDFDGKCCFEWRQGIKHDCSKIMELSKKGKFFINGNGDVVDIEDGIVFPLVKSSMFKTPIVHDFSKFVIVTQQKIGDDTSYIKNDFPKTWNYLEQNQNVFDARKSSIYKNSHKFSMFGVGEYSFSKYKVGVSGFYKKPMFSVLTSNNQKPAMADDTSYFISFDNYDDAYIAMLILNSEKVQSFLQSISFADAKRPFSKKILERLDFGKIANQISFRELEQTENNLSLNSYCTEKMYQKFSNYIPVELFLA